jgi:hypothetical protein
MGDGLWPSEYPEEHSGDSSRPQMPSGPLRDAWQQAADELGLDEAFRKAYDQLDAEAAIVAAEPDANATTVEIPQVERQSWIRRHQQELAYAGIMTLIGGVVLSALVTAATDQGPPSPPATGNFYQTNRSDFTPGQTMALHNSIDLRELGVCYKSLIHAAQDLARSNPVKSQQLYDAAAAIPDFTNCTLPPGSDGTLAIQIDVTDGYTVETVHGYDLVGPWAAVPSPAPLPS